MLEMHISIINGKGTVAGVQARFEKDDWLTERHERLMQTIIQPIVDALRHQVLPDEAERLMKLEQEDQEVARKISEILPKGARIKYEITRP